MIKADSPYATAFSLPIEVVVADFCLETEYIINVIEVELDLTLLGPQVTKTFDKPVTDLELEMRVPNICGPVVYELTLESGPPGSNLQPTLDQNVPSISAQSTRVNQVGEYTFILRSQAVNYPQLFNERPVFLTVGECIVQQFEFAEKFEDVEYVVATPTITRQIPQFLIVPACPYEVTYTASLVDNVNQLQGLPNGMEFDVNLDQLLEFSVDIINESQIGEYVIQILGSIDEGP